MDDPHLTLRKALIAEGWTARRLAEELGRHAHAANEPDRAAHESHLSRIVNGERRPTRAQAVGIYAVLVGAPSPIVWDQTFTVAEGEAVPTPAKPIPPKPLLAKARPGRR